MDIYEEAVLQYIAAPPWRFVNPQMSLPYEKFKGESCPDFVVLDLKLNKIYVVEVTSAWDITSHLGKIKDREKRWYEPLRRLFDERHNQFFKEWKYRSTLFVREDRFDSAKSILKGNEDISVFNFDIALHGWKWKWGKDDMNPLEFAPENVSDQ